MLAATKVKMIMSESAQEHIRHLIHKTRYYEVSGSFML